MSFQVGGWVYQDLRLAVLNADEEADHGGGSSSAQVLVDDPWVKVWVNGYLSDRIEAFAALVDTMPVMPMPGRMGERAVAGGLPKDVMGRDPMGLLREAHVTVKDVVPRLDIRIGRQMIDWSLLQERYLDMMRPLDNEPFHHYQMGHPHKAGGMRETGFSWFMAVPAVHLDYHPGPLRLMAYYTPEPVNAGNRFDPLSRERLAGRITYSTNLGGFDVLGGTQVVLDFAKDGMMDGGMGGGGGGMSSPGGEDRLGWGVQGAVGKSNVRTFYALYGEYGQPDDDTGDRYWVVGARADFLKLAGVPAVSAFVERDIRNDESAFEVTWRPRQINEYLSFIFGGDTNPAEPGDDAWNLYLVTRLGTLF